MGCGIPVSIDRIRVRVNVEQKASDECLTLAAGWPKVRENQVTRLGMRLRHLEAGHIILADRIGILRILGLLARIDAASRSSGIESRARSVGCVAWCHLRIGTAAALVRLAGVAGAVG